MAFVRLSPRERAEIVLAIDLVIPHYIGPQAGTQFLYISIREIFAARSSDTGPFVDVPLSKQESVLVEAALSSHRSLTTYAGPAPPYPQEGPILRQRGPKPLVRIGPLMRKLRLAQGTISLQSNPELAQDPEYQ